MTDPGLGLGGYLPAVETALAGLQEREITGRIWRHDHSLWKPDPTEISNRMGWLTVTGLMSEQVPAIEAFAEDVREAGFRHVVLLGMGGSSLGPEVLSESLRGGSQSQESRKDSGNAGGYPKLILLDSTVPAWVLAVTGAIDPARTLFIVSSKSGSTLEPNTFYAYFRGLVEGALEKERAGGNFVAITDPGTPLEALALEHGFRKVFLNPPDVGGRYSVLSYFGLVPAALIGVNIGELLDRANFMKESCAARVPAQENPGAWLGAVMGTLAGTEGRDKLSLMTSPSISTFGLWVEQIIAESTGKEGKGIVPVAGESIVGPEHYGDDRLFVYLRLKGDQNAETDAAMERIASSGQPVVRLDMSDTYQLGAEFYRWEFAIAVAGHILGIHPFDQPNVQGAKDMTDRVLQEYQSSGSLPQMNGGIPPDSLLAEAGPGQYLAILAYLNQTPEMDKALTELRARLMKRYRIATTMGYGPRYLHSTGQLHKGGPNSGIFLQLTAGHERDVPIPGRPYSFGLLADSQALGDLQALAGSGRRALRVRLGRDQVGDIHRLAEKLAGKLT